jgi:hypothetical protein
MWIAHHDLVTSAFRFVKLDMFVTILDEVKIINKGILSFILHFAY